MTIFDAYLKKTNIHTEGLYIITGKRKFTLFADVILFVDDVRIVERLSGI